MSKGGNFVLNVGPTATGEFPAGHLGILDAVGAWPAMNGEAIYGTVPAPGCLVYSTNDFQAYATMTSSNLYVQVVRWPADGSKGIVRINRPDLIQAELLDSAWPPIRFTTVVEGGDTVLELGKPSKVDPYATVVRLRFKVDLF